jgi:hypothetical protein
VLCEVTMVDHDYRHRPVGGPVSLAEAAVGASPIEHRRPMAPAVAHSEQVGAHNLQPLGQPTPKELGLTTNRFILAKFHRPESTHNPAALETALRELGNLSLPVVLPLHLRTQDRIVAKQKRSSIAAFAWALALRAPRVESSGTFDMTFASGNECPRV